MARLFERRAKRHDLLFHEQPGYRRQVLRQPLGRRVRAMRSAERVVDEHVGQASQLSGEARIVGFFFGVKAHVFQQHDLARPERTDRVLGGWPDAVL